MASPTLNRSGSNRSLDFDSALSDCGSHSAGAGRATAATAAAAAALRSSTSRRSESPAAAAASDVDSGSVYSCDAEGYYTSFHIDSGLKTLREAPSQVPEIFLAFFFVHFFF